MHRPGPDSVRKAEQRAAVRHPGEAKSPATISVYRRWTRQMRGIGAAAERHLLFLPLWRGECVAAGTDAKIDQDRRGDEDRRVGTDQDDAKHHRGGKAMNSLPPEQQQSQ